MKKSSNDKKANNGEGNVRSLPDGNYECIIQSKYLNPKTGKPKRIKRKGKIVRTGKQWFTTKTFTCKKGKARTNQSSYRNITKRTSITWGSA